MKVVLSGAQVYPHMRKQLLSVTTIQAMLIGLTAFSLLVSCTSPEGVFGTRTKTTAAATAMPTPQGLIWSDEFDGPKGTPPDPSKWTPQIGGGGWGNQELEYDTNNQNAYQDGQGNLVLEARQENPVGSYCWYGPCQYTSARITTRGHLTFTYGRLEARIKLPSGQGMWPTFWLVGDNCDTVGWPTCGEIDVMENIGKEPSKNHGVAHGPGYADNPDYFSGYYKLSRGAFSDDFHIFALQWDSNQLSFFVDGINYKTVDRATITNQTYWVFDHPFYIILNVAVGGPWPGNPDSTTVFPQKMYVSYVRLYANK